jgi:hypothetical protein
MVARSVAGIFKCSEPTKSVRRNKQLTMTTMRKMIEPALK